MAVNVSEIVMRRVEAHDPFMGTLTSCRRWTHCDSFVRQRRMKIWVITVRATEPSHSALQPPIGYLTSDWRAHPPHATARPAMLAALV